MGEGAFCVKEACFDLSEKQQMRECVFSRPNQLLKCVDLPAEEPQVSKVVCFKVFWIQPVAML